MQTLKRILVVVLAALVLSSLAALTVSASDEISITATVGDSVDWRSYFTKPDGFITWNPHVWDYDDAGYAQMSGEYIIRCKKAGCAIFAVAFGDPEGGGYVCTLHIDIKPKDGGLLVFRTSRGKFANGRDQSSMTIAAAVSTINASQCPSITGSGYKPEGWRVGAKSYSGAIPVNAGGVTYLDAAWRPYSISLNANGGSVNPTVVSAVNGGAIGELPTPTRSAYLFDGWYTQQYGGDLWTAEKVYPYTHDTTLYAHWTSATTTISTVYISGVPSPKVGAAVSTSGVKVTEGVTTEAGMYWSKKSDSGNYYQTTDTTFREGGEYRWY